MSYSRNKYRCLLGPNKNVIVCDDNNIKPKPRPHIYPYDGFYPYDPYGYPRYLPGYLPRPIPYVDTMPPMEPKPTPKPTPIK